MTQKMGKLVRIITISVLVASQLLMAVTYLKAYFSPTKDVIVTINDLLWFELPLLLITLPLSFYIWLYYIKLETKKVKT